MNEQLKFSNTLKNKEYIYKFEGLKELTKHYNLKYVKVKLKKLSFRVYKIKIDRKGEIITIQW